jgi:hypothetical protein
MKTHRPFDGATYSTLRKEQKYWSKLFVLLVIGFCCTIYLFQYTVLFCLGYVLLSAFSYYLWVIYISKKYNMMDANFIFNGTNYEDRKYYIDLYKEEVRVRSQGGDWHLTMPIKPKNPKNAKDDIVYKMRRRYIDTSRLIRGYKEEEE